VLINLSRSKWLIGIFWCSNAISISALFFNSLLSHGSSQSWIIRFSTTTGPILNDPKKVLPQGIPLVIWDKPEKFDAMNFKVGTIVSHFGLQMHLIDLHE